MHVFAVKDCLFTNKIRELGYIFTIGLLLLWPSERRITLKNFSYRDFMPLTLTGGKKGILKRFFFVENHFPHEEWRFPTFFSFFTLNSDIFTDLDDYNRLTVVTIAANLVNVNHQT